MSPFLSSLVMPFSPFFVEDVDSRSMVGSLWTGISRRQMCNALRVGCIHVCTDEAGSTDLDRRGSVCQVDRLERIASAARLADESGHSRAEQK